MTIIFPDCISENQGNALSHINVHVDNDGIHIHGEEALSSITKRTTLYKIDSADCEKVFDSTTEKICYRKVAHFSGSRIILMQQAEKFALPKTILNKIQNAENANLAWSLAIILLALQVKKCLEFLTEATFFIPIGEKMYYLSVKNKTDSTDSELLNSIAKAVVAAFNLIVKTAEDMTPNIETVQYIIYPNQAGAVYQNLYQLYSDALREKYNIQ